MFFTAMKNIEQRQGVPACVARREDLVTAAEL
jgi:hypothetical protein